MVDSLTEISASDVREHPAFAFAPIGVLGNSERERLNFVQAEQFAKYHRRPLITWRYPLTTSDGETLSGMDLDQLYNDERGMLGIFVKDAPGMLLKNIQSTKGLVNGSVGFLHSLTFGGSTPRAVAEAEQMKSCFKITKY